MLRNFSLSTVFLALCSGLFSLNLQAAQFETFGDYVVHYNAINTSLLQPEVAKQYGINRSKNRALLNISVRKKGAGNMTQDSAVTALVKVTATNLNAQLQTLDMREIREGDAIYYIAQLSIDNAETLNFNVKVDPEYKGQQHEVKFRQQFFVD